MLSNRDDIGPGNFCDGDSTVGLVGNIEVNMVRSYSCRYGEFEILGFAETVFGQVARMEADGK